MSAIRAIVLAQRTPVHNLLQTLDNQTVADKPVLVLESDDTVAEGYLCCVIAVLFFGSNFLPVKKIESGDGVWFALWMSVGILFVGAFVGLHCAFSAFYPFAMLGGALWATGNMFAVQVIQAIGMGPGLLVWGMSNMLTGWATGYFGLFGMTKEIPKNNAMNISGMILAVISLLIFSTVKTGDNTEDEHKEHDAKGASSPITRLRGRTKKLAGFSLALLAGTFFGSNFDPPTLLLQKGKADLKAGLPPTYSVDIFDYVFAHFCGIFLTNLVYFLIYFGLNKTPYTAWPVMVPAALSGVAWGIAQVAWFKANDVLSFIVAFPIITTLPGVVGSLWGIFLFGELNDSKSRFVLATVVVIQVCAVTLIALSSSEN